MKKELHFYEEVSAKAYLRELLVIYPYDIEEEMVFSLLNKTTYPHPVLLSFIQYFCSVLKIHITHKDSALLSSNLHHMMEKMSRLSLQSGSILHLHQYAFDATYQIKPYHLSHPYAHLPLSHIAFVQEIHLHTIPICSMSTYREDFPITYAKNFIFQNISMDAKNFLGVCIKIADKQGIVFLSTECLSFAMALSAMYPIQTPSVTYDFLVIFGLQAKENSRTYYYDQTNALYIGLVAGDTSIYHFLYLKEMILVLYNSICIHKHDLPIHASMIELKQDKEEFHMVFAGATGSGKSEMLDAMRLACLRNHIPSQCYYDDSGILHYLDNVIVSTGSEVSACKRILFQKQQLLFEAFLDSIFLSEHNNVTYQIKPLTTHEKSLQFHPIQVLCYLDAFANHKGIRIVDDLQTAIELFMGDENTFFCGTLGCQEHKQEVMALMKDFFTLLFINSIPIYHVSTRGTSYQKETLFDKIADLLLTTVLP